MRLKAEKETLIKERGELSPRRDNLRRSLNALRRGYDEAGHDELGRELEDIMNEKSRLEGITSEIERNIDRAEEREKHLRMEIEEYRYYSGEAETYSQAIKLLEATREIIKESANNPKGMRKKRDLETLKEPTPQPRIPRHKPSNNKREVHDNHKQRKRHPSA